MWQTLSDDAREVILFAQERALSANHDTVSSVDFFLALLELATPDTDLGILLLSAGLKREEAHLYVEAHQEQASVSPDKGEPTLTPDAKHALEHAAAEARSMGNRYIAPEHLLLGCLNPQVESNLRATLTPLGWNLDVLRVKQGELNVQPQPQNTPLDVLTVNGEKVVEAAYIAMRATWCGRISTSHLLLGVLQDEQVGELLRELGTSPNELQARVRAQIRSDSQLATPDKRFDNGAKRALERARQYAFSNRHKYIGPEYILLGLLPQKSTLQEKLKWGAQVPDDSAPLLSELDALKLRALITSPIAKAPPRHKPASTDIPHYASYITFGCLFLAGAFGSLSLDKVRGVPSPAQATIQLAGITVFLSALLITSLGACWMLLLSRKSNLKSAWGASFFGFLLGSLVVVMLLNR